MIVVIGASSFIGVYVVEELLKNNCKVVATGRNNTFAKHYSDLNVDYLKLDLTEKEDFDRLPRVGVEGVILLAGLLPANAPVNLDVEENAADYFKVNTIGTINVLEYCRINSIKRVISTTSYSDVFNSWQKDVRITESEPRGFKFSGDHAAYVISKNAATDIMEYYNQQHGMKNAVFRLPPVYGVGPHGSLYVNGTYVKSGLQIFIENAAKGDDIVIYGDRNLSRDVVYVKDVAHAFYLAMKSEKTSGLYNMTSGKGVTLQQQAEIIAKQFAPSPQVVSEIKYNPDVQNSTPSYLFSMEKAKRDFDFVPQFSDFETMMNDYMKDLHSNKFKDLFKY